MSGLLFFLILVIAVGFGRSVRAQTLLFDEGRRDHVKDVWQIDLLSTYYKSTANYSRSGGQFNSLPAGYSYQLLDFDFGVRGLPLRNWAFYAATRVSNAESKDLLSTRRNSSFTQIQIGTDYLYSLNRQYDLIPDFSVLVPLARVDVTADEVLNREGALEVSTRLIGRAHWGRWNPFAFAGVTYRDENRASLLPYGLGAEVFLTSWVFGGELRGYETLNRDKYSDDPLKRETSALKNGGSLRYFSVNPSLLETNVWIRKSLGESLALKFGGGASITGAATSAGWNVVAGLSYRLGSLKGSRNSSPPTTEETHRFQEETNDGVDQNLFRVEPPPPAPTDDQQRKKIQKDLDQTEFQIELKRPAKKKRKR